MSKICAAMRRNGRHVVPHFHPDEYLYRRIPLDSWPDASVSLEVDAVNLPDLSVGRSQFGHPEWLRVDMQIDGSGQKYEKFFDGWGVIGFQVSKIPPTGWENGVPRFTFKVFHAPEDHNYPHSEVRCFEGSTHIKPPQELPDEMHIWWREMLLRAIDVFLKPNQPATFRQTAPASHKPEMPIPP
jgi:hypothetical protein